MVQSFGYTDSADNQKKQLTEKISPDAGPYIGVVVFPADPTRMGKLGVNIPELTKTTRPKAEQIIYCDYLSPFYGGKPGASVSKTDPYSYRTSQNSYGMWFVPPDIGTEVMVMFVKGEKQKSAYWLGCVQKPLINQEIPAYGSSENTSVGVETTGDMGTQTTEDIYGTKLLPAGETNFNFGTPDAIPGNYNDKGFKRPVNDLLADQMMRQGLVDDPIRGPISSSARRETPSKVFGFSTPGPIRPDSRELNIGLEGAKVKVDRNLGHSFVMDDGDFLGKNKLTRLRTASGHQILMHDTEGSIYIANGSGNAWIEMTAEGRIDVYSGIGGINFRTEGDFNFHADNNVNINAGKSIRMNATTEFVQSAGSMFTLGEEGIFTASQTGSIMNFAKSGISSYTPAQQLHGAGGPIHLAGAQVHFNSTSANASWGPNWLTPTAAGIEPYEANDIELADKGIKPLESFTRKTKTTVHRFVHHEPMPRFKSFSAGSVLPIDADDKKAWRRLVDTPGTEEFIAQQNRLSDVETIRDAQYQTDTLQFLKNKMGNSTDVTKARTLIAEFAKGYDDTFNVINSVGSAWDTAKSSISNKIGAFPISDSLDASGLVKDNVSKISSQVIESFTNNTSDLFADNVFVNQSGDLFSLGKSVHSDITKNIKGIDAINSLKGNLSVENLGSTLASVSSVSQTYKNIIGGNLTNISNVQSVVKNLGMIKTAIGSAGSDPRQLARMGVSKQTIALSQGFLKAKTAVTSFFKGFKWSDKRLKEEVRFIGKSPAGINIYSFKYKQLPGRYIGVMAQEVPWARKMTDTGFYAVDYSKVDVKFRRLN